MKNHQNCGQKTSANILFIYFDSKRLEICFFKYIYIFNLFCSFDLRQQSLDDQGKIWASESNSKMARAQLFTHSEPTAVLALHGVTQEDAGTYRCRVDFKRSPTRYRKIALDVIGKFIQGF